MYCTDVASKVALAAAATFKTKRTIEVVNWSPRETWQKCVCMISNSTAITEVFFAQSTMPAYFIDSPRAGNELCTLCQIAEIEEVAEALVGTNVKHAAVADFIDSPCQVSSKYH